MLITKRPVIGGGGGGYCHKVFKNFFKDIFIDCHQGDKTPPHTHTHTKRWGVLGMILNHILWWGSSSGDMESVKYLFITITPKVNADKVVVPVRAPSMGQIDLFKNYLDLIRLCAKKKKLLKSNYSKM